MDYTRSLFPKGRHFFQVEIYKVGIIVTDIGGKTAIQIHEDIQNVLKILRSYLIRKSLNKVCSV